MPRIIAYHPEIFVRQGAEVVMVQMDLEDWAPDEEVLDILVDWTGARTMGEVVARLEGNRNPRARIEKIDRARESCLIREGRRIYEAGDRI